MPAVSTEQPDSSARGRLLALSTSLAGALVAWWGLGGSSGSDCRHGQAIVVETAAGALPSIDLCLTCHWRLWARADMLAPLHPGPVQHGCGWPTLEVVLGEPPHPGIEPEPQSGTEPGTETGP
jgi:hypothetical protein